VRLAVAAMLAGPITLVLMSPWVAARLFDGRAPARTVATFHLLALAGMAALPLVVLPCFAVVRPGDLAALASPRLIQVAQAASHGLAIAYLLRLAWVAASTARARSRLAEALRAAERLRVAGAPARSAGYVVAATPPVAYALGGRSGGVVVSRGLLALLDDDERDAVLAHEFAHLRLRHHRLLLFAQVVRTTLGAAVPAAREAAASLARELEVIADEAAATAVGDRRVVARALAKAALATAGSAPALAFGGDGDLAYRLDRLTGDRPCQDRRGLAVAGIGLLVAELGVIVAVALRPAGPVAGVVVGGLAVVGIGWLAGRGVVSPASRGCQEILRPSSRIQTREWR
jgi:Zn-dependent protease with chaperone function